MTDPPHASQSATRPNHVWVYGNDHSPWAQADLLGLHENEIAHTLATIPPLSVFLRSGVLMPAAKIDDGPWNFWRRFSYARDDHSKLTRRMWKQFWRSFSIFYFSRWDATRDPDRPRNAWPANSRSFRNGSCRARLFSAATHSTPSISSSSVSFRCTRTSRGPRSRCSRRIRPSDDSASGSRRCRVTFPTTPTSTPQRTSRRSSLEMAPTTRLERVFYWAGAALMWIAFPITLPTVLYFSRRVRNKPAAPSVRT
jgi:hypothetical protein